MHAEALTSNTKRVLESLGDATLTKNVYLAGGTALALYCGHRFSIDLDWFGQGFKFTEEFRRKLSSAGKLRVISQSEDTFHGQLDNVGVSFFRYPYKLLFSKKKYNQNIYLADEKDIACMKLDAIASRGSKKDFVDMYFLLHNFSLETLIDLMPKKFEIEYNVPHLLKALTYFEDAERTPMPEMIRQARWKDIKKFLLSAVKQYMN